MLNQNSYYVLVRQSVHERAPLKRKLSQACLGVFESGVQKFGRMREVKISHRTPGKITQTAGF